LKFLSKYDNLLELQSGMDGPLLGFQPANQHSVVYYSMDDDDDDSTNDGK
jgi:hypothetical protein